MNKHFKIDGPTCINFSGGRTSAYMLWRVLQANGGLTDDCKVIFANTGKEDEATLRFVQRCSQEWGIEIDWVEYRNDEMAAFRWALVDFETASRNGEPFTALNRDKRYLPTAMARFCTIKLKIEPAACLMRDCGYTEWDSFIGIRADEQRRVSKIRANPVGGVGCERVMPLADCGITKKDVLDFWRSQPFDLELPVINGISMHGNCDLCFLKPTGQLVSLMSENQKRATWWIKEEEWAQTIVRDKNSRGIHFRPNDPSYDQMLKFSKEQRGLFDSNEESIACFCGD